MTPYLLTSTALFLLLVVLYDLLAGGWNVEADDDGAGDKRLSVRQQRFGGAA